MNLALNIANLSKPKKVLLFSAILLFFIFVRHNGKAFAACGVNTGKSTSYAGLVVDVKWLDNGGGWHDDNTTDVFVYTNLPSSTPGGNNVVSSTNGFTSTAGASNGAIVNQGNFGCTGDGINAVFGYGAASTDAGGSGKTFALDCDESAHPAYNQSFTVTGTATPPGALPGGVWFPVTVDPGNGFTDTVQLAYIEPAQTDIAVKGDLESASCSAGMVGWAYDGDDDNTSLSVRLYIDGVYVPPQHPANIPRVDINFRFFIAGNHGYSIPFPASAIDGLVHTIKIVGIGITGSGSLSGRNVQLGSSIKVNTKPCTSLVGNYSVSCPNMTVTGKVTDPLDPGTPLDVRIVIDGDPPDTVTTNNGGNFTYTIPAGYIDNSVHSIVVTGIGSVSKNTVIVGVANFGPCNRKPTGTLRSECVDIYGTATDPDTAGQIDVNVYVDGTLINAVPITTTGGAHNYTTLLPDVYKDTANHTVVVRALDVNALGAAMGQVTIGTIVVNCGPPIKSFSFGCYTSVFIYDPSYPWKKSAGDPKGVMFVDIIVDGTKYVNVTSASPVFPQASFNNGNGPVNGQNLILNMSAWFGDYNKHTVSVIVKGVDSNGNPDGVDTTLGPTVIGPCGPSCGTQTTNPISPQPTQPFSVTNLSWNYTMGNVPGFVPAPVPDWSLYNISIRIPDASYNNPSAESLYTLMPNGLGGTSDLSSPINGLTIPASGNHRVILVVSGPQFRLVCDSGKSVPPIPNDGIAAPVYGTSGAAVPFTNTQYINCIPVAALPYIKVFGNDVFSGGEFSLIPPCNITICGDIRAYGSNASGNWLGSSVEYGAFAVGSIIHDETLPEGFYSASQTHQSTGYYTSFANSFGGFGGGNTGGQFGTPANHIVADYINNTKITPISYAGTTMNVCNQADGQYLVNHPINISCSGGGGFKGHITIYTTNPSAGNFGNDVFVSTNINYKNYSVKAPNTGDVPYLTVIASGSNIFVSNTVSSIDGVFIAIPDKNDIGASKNIKTGRIYTCMKSLDFTTAASGNTTNNNRAIRLLNDPNGTYGGDAACKLQLNINGSLIAKKVVMGRTFGSQYLATIGDDATTNKAAEIYNMGPESYLGKPLLKPSLGGTDSVFTEIQSLTDVTPLF